MSLRDWIDPTRLYNQQLPASRLNFVWGGCLVPIIVLVLSVSLIMKAYIAWGEDLCIVIISMPIMFLCIIGLHAISATRRIHDLGDPPDLGPIFVPDDLKSEEEISSYVIHRLLKLIAEPGIHKSETPADGLTDARSNNH